MSIDPSIREQIILAVMSHLETEQLSAPAEIPVPVRTRLVSPNADQLPVITVYPGREMVSPMHPSRQGHASRGAVVVRALELKVEIVVKASGDGADSESDPLLTWVTIAMGSMGRIGVNLSNDPPDEALVEFGYEQGQFSFVRVTQTFVIEYQTKTGDPTLLA